MTVQQTVPCPFCGLACDDLSVDAAPGRLDAGGGACPLARESFAALAAGDGAPRVDGAAASWDQAIAAAAALLAGARQPLFGGLATDVDGMRAVLALADRVGGVVDHMNSAAQLANLRTVQDRGWITTTLTEVRNRADLVVLAGTAASARFPRFFERLLAPADGMFGPLSRQVVVLGRGVDTPAGAENIPCEVGQLAQVAGALNALAAGRQLSATDVAGVPLARLADLAGRMKAARYGVLVWAAGDLPQPNAELAVEAFSRLLAELNRSTRFNGLPLGGLDADMCAAQVATWQTGYPQRISFGGGAPEYDPVRFDPAAMLPAGEADALLWLSAFRRDRLPPAGPPTVLLAPPGAAPASEPRVFLPVATPGVDHAGYVYRTDNVVAVPLKKLRDSALPSAGEVLRRIAAALPGGKASC